MQAKNPAAAARARLQALEKSAPGPLSVLRATHELPVSQAVLSGHLQTLVQVAQSPNARVAADVGEIQRPSPPLPSVATSDL